MNARKPYPCDASDEERSFVVPFLALVREDSEQRRHALREALNALRWMRAGRFGAIVHDRRELLRACDGRKAQPVAMIMDSRTLQSTPESGARTGYDRAKRLTGSKMHLAVDTPGQLRALHVTPANERDLIKRFRTRLNRPRGKFRFTLRRENRCDHVTVFASIFNRDQELPFPGLFGSTTYNLLRNGKSVKNASPPGNPSKIRRFSLDHR